MRKFLIGALGLSLTGCSHPPPPQTATTCSDAYGPPYFDMSAAGPPLKLTSFRTKSVATRGKASRAAKARLPSDHAGAVPNAKAAPSIASAAHQQSASSGIPLPRRSPQAPQLAAAPATSDPVYDGGGTLPSADGKGPPAVTASIEDQVTAAMADAERRKAPVSEDDADHLVAVIMTRLDIKSISDLTGKTVAIPDRYSAASGNIRIAIVAAGANKVELSEEAIAPIDRLMSGTVQAAVMALMSDEAAQAFPDIAGFRTFRVPLSPRSLKDGP